MTLLPTRSVKEDPFIEGCIRRAMGRIASLIADGYDGPAIEEYLRERDGFSRPVLYEAFRRMGFDVDVDHAIKREEDVLLVGVASGVSLGEFECKGIAGASAGHGKPHLTLVVSRERPLQQVLPHRASVRFKQAPLRVVRGQQKQKQGQRP